MKNCKSDPTKLDLWFVVRSIAYNFTTFGRGKLKSSETKNPAFFPFVKSYNSRKVKGMHQNGGIQKLLLPQVLDTLT